MMRGQLSIEFIVVITGLLMILATITIPMYDRARADVEKASKLADAREAANEIANTMDKLYTSGPGSKLIIEYWLPKGVVVVYVGGYENLDVDGIDTTSGSAPRNGRADVQIRFDFDGDGAWTTRGMPPC